MISYEVPPHHHLTPANETHNRISRFRQAVVEHGLDAALLLDPVNIFYLSGTTPAGQILVPANGSPMLLVRRRIGSESGKELY